jgi:hypothetical protein
MEYLEAAIGHCVNVSGSRKRRYYPFTPPQQSGGGRRFGAWYRCRHRQGCGMDPKWQKLDLEGGGLQAMNLRLARTLRHRRTAWSLLLLFPLGAHRWYLHETGWAVAYLLLTLAAAAGWVGGWTWLLFALPLLLLLLIADIAGLDNRIAAFNKRQRMAAYLSPGAGAPADFRGRIPGKPGQQTPARVPGFAEQEKLLRALADKTPGSAGENRNNP